MNGYDIYKKAIARLGIDSGDEITLDNTGFLHILECTNQILHDLKLNPVKELSEEIMHDASALEAICCGVTMLLALSEGETEKNQIFTAIYNAKRAALLGKTSHIEDTLPVSESGD